MARAGEGWVNTSKNDYIQDFWSSNVLKRTVYEKKIPNLPPLNIHYDTPCSPTGKQWTDQSLLSNRSLNNFLAESDAFQRASYANILEKWKEHDKNEVSRLINSFDSHYNMKIRFRQDVKLNRASEMIYGPGAKYYRFIGSESNPKNIKPCSRHKRRVQEYEERHIRELLELPTKTKSRSKQYLLPKIKKRPSIETNDQSITTTRSSVSGAENSW